MTQGRPCRGISLTVSIMVFVPWKTTAPTKSEPSAQSCLFAYWLTFRNRLELIPALPPGAGNERTPIWARFRTSVLLLTNWAGVGPGAPP